MSGLAAELGVARRPRAGPPFRLELELRATDGITVVCGASGSGKSTLLLALAGWLRPDRGRIVLDARTLFDSATGVDLATRRRRIGLLPQEAPLFPHLDVGRNVAFALRGRRRAGRARELLERVGGAELSTRRVRELSGGERQRAALARALASRPRALLLDEPFSALDPAGRRALGALLVELQRESGIPFVHVTHDVAEALRLGTSMVLLEAGRVIQAGPPAAILAHPGSLAAARAVGTENLLRGRVTRHLPEQGCSEIDLGGTVVLGGPLDLPPGAEVTLGLRAEEILVSLRALAETSARNVVAGVVESVEPRGGAVELRVATPVALRVLVTPASVRALALEPGRRVFLLIKASAFHRLI